MADKINMPSSFGGLVRYFDEYQSRIELKPAHVVLAIVVVVIFEIVIRHI